MDLKAIQDISIETFSIWNNQIRGWAPKEVVDKLEAAKLDWLEDLTMTLSIWVNIGEEMTDGELILAYTNLGSLVEGWLKLYYCVYYMDYLIGPKTDSKGKMIEPNDLKFEYLIQFSRDKLWKTNDSNEIWVRKIQHRRNAIHSFNDRDIGNPSSFLEDLKKYYDFVIMIESHFPYFDKSDYY